MITKEFEFQNGDVVTEKVTGFKGTITGTVYYLTGCSQYMVTPKCKVETKASEGSWYDESRLELVGEGVSEDDVKGKNNGCDIIPPIGERGD